MLIECLILNARERHGISGRFTTNGLELKHRLQKKVIDEDEVPKKIFAVSKALKTWIQSNDSEVRQAIRGLDKYRLTPEFLIFYLEPAMWVQWSEERRSQNYEALLLCIPQVLEYWKPKSAVQKSGNPGKNKRRARLPEPELFIKRADINDVSENNFYTTTSKEKKQLETQNQLSRYGKIKGRSKAISTFFFSVKIENLELHYFKKKSIFYRRPRRYSSSMQDKFQQKLYCLSFKGFLR